MKARLWPQSDLMYGPSDQSFVDYDKSRLYTGSLHRRQENLKIDTLMSQEVV